VFKDIKPTKRSEPNTVNHSTSGPPIVNSKARLRKLIAIPYNAIGLKKSAWRSRVMLIEIKVKKLSKKKVDDAIK
jgi:hypothetical protein